MFKRKESEQKQSWLCTENNFSKSIFPRQSISFSVSYGYSKRSAAELTVAKV